MRIERITYSTWSIGRVNLRVSPNNISSTLRPNTCSTFGAAARRLRTVENITHYSFPSQPVSKMMKKSLTLNSNVITSSKPSVVLGFMKREAKLEKAKCGRTDRFSGLNASPAKALTILLCSQSLRGALKNTHRIGNPNFWESRIHTARVSRSPFVLSVAINQIFFSQLNIGNNQNSYLSLLLCPERENLMRPWHILLSYQQVYGQQVIMKGVG